MDDSFKSRLRLQDMKRVVYSCVYNIIILIPGMFFMVTFVTFK